MWRLENNFWELVPSLYHVGSESQVFRFGDKYLNPLSHLTTPLYANF